MLKRAEMLPGVKIRMRQNLFYPSFGWSEKQAVPCITGGSASPADFVTNGASTVVGFQTSATANPGDVMEVMTKVKHYQTATQAGKQFQLKDPQGNVGWFFWSFIYTNADKI